MISLIRTQVAVALNLAGFFQRRKVVKNVLLAALIVAAMAPSYGGFIFFMVMKPFQMLGQSGFPIHDVLLGGYYSLAQIAALVLGVPTVYSMFIRAKDLSILLPLPFRPWQILAAKLVALYISELTVAVLFFAPALISYGVYGRPGVWPLVNGALSMLLLPVIPLCISTVLAMLVMNIPVIGRSKWLWHGFLMVVGISIALMFNMLTVVGPAVDMSSIVSVKMRAFTRIGSYIPGSIFAIRAMAQGGLGGAANQVLSIVCSGAYILATLALGERLYIRPVVRGEGAAPAVRRSTEAFVVRGFTSSYIRKELACAFREPAVAINSLGGYISLPIVMLMWFAQKIASKGKIDILGDMTAAMHSRMFVEFLPIVVVGTGLGLALIGATSSLFAASYSKDGKRLWLERSLPVTSFDIFMGKLAAGMFVVTILNLITVVALSFVLPVPRALLVYSFILSELAIATVAIGSLLIDCHRPKLVWKDAVQAVKQNINVFFAMLYSLLVLGLNVVVIVLITRAAGSPLALYSSIMGLNLALFLASLAAARPLSEALGKAQV